MPPVDEDLISIPTMNRTGRTIGTQAAILNMLHARQNARRNLCIVRCCRDWISVYDPRGQGRCGICEEVPELVAVDE